MNPYDIIQSKHFGRGNPYQPIRALQEGASSSGTYSVLTEAGDTLITEAGDTIVTEDA